MTVIAALLLFFLSTAARAPEPYDPARDAAADVRRAVEDAGRSGKRVLVEVGGNWCIWCRTMDRFFDQNADLLRFREEKYVLVKVNYSPENRNKELLSRYPKIPGYPHIFVLDSKGALLHSQNTSELEAGKGYDLAKFRQFLEKWAPGPTTSPGR